ncbi:hypothetical protein N9D41_00200 [Gammaproteobacteria bacterium]|nr:hypothetical protein [Gammaproteobacteria bacterium]
MISNVALFFILLPYIGIAALPSDIQPFAVLFAIFYLFISKSTFTRNEIMMFMLVIFSLVFAILNTAIFYELSFIDIFRYSFGYITPIVIYAYVKNNNFTSDQIKRTLDYILAILMIGYIINYMGLTYLIQPFVNRAIYDAEDVRGFTSFFPEQSIVATQLFFYAFIYYIFNTLNRLRLLIIIFFALLSLSGQTFINLLAFFICLGVYYSIIKFKLKYFFYLTIFIVFISNFDLISIGNALNLPMRGLVVITAFYEQGLNFLLVDKGIVFKLSGLIYGIAGVLDLNLIPSIYKTHYLDMLNTHYLEYICYEILNLNSVVVPQNPYSIFGSISYDFGLYGLLVLLLLFFYTFSNLYLGGIKTSFIIILLFMLFLFFVHSFMAQPTFWFILFLILAKREKMHV